MKKWTKAEVERFFSDPYVRHYPAPKTPPVYEKTLSFRTFARQDKEYREKFPHGRICPQSVKEYADYKYYAITHRFNAVAGAVQPEETAFEQAKEFFMLLEDDFMDYLLDEIEDNPLDTFNLV